MTRSHPQHRPSAAAPPAPMPHRSYLLAALALAALAASLMLATPATAATFDQVARALPDECFRDLGDSAPIDFEAFPGTGCDEEAGYQPKINEAYIWSMAGIVATGENGGTPGAKLFFGTASNPLCQTAGAFGLTNGLDPFTDGTVACEFALAPDSQSNGGPLPDFIADLRPPGMYAYEVDSGNLVALSGAQGPLLPPDAQAALEITNGVRGAVAWNDLVILFGPSIRGGINAFAFDASTLEFIDWALLPELGLLRKCIVVPGSDPDIAYCAVGTARDEGAIIRMIGDKSSPFDYAVVGRLNGRGANIAWSPAHNRVFVTSWANRRTAGVSVARRASVWRGPVHPPQGYRASQERWEVLFNLREDYEPDDLISRLIGMGDVVDCNGDLLFGTMTFPSSAKVAHFSLNPELYGPGGAYQGQIDTLVARPASVFALREPGSENPVLQMLYGSEMLPAFDGVDLWETVPNAGGLPSENLSPDGSGFGNPENHYIWLAFNYQDRCYIGTFDLTSPTTDEGVLVPEGGGDLWVFDSVEAPATPVTTQGADNPFNYGFRTAVEIDGRLFIGSANPYNLVLPNAPPYFTRGGGWELLEFQP
ncbi:MAG: hypothetical protein AAF184_21030 [Pseudomonadota bacterium]